MSQCLKGKDVSHPDYENLGYEAIWKSVRVLKAFSRVELILHVAKNSSWSVNDWTVKSYVQRLERGGYIEVTRKSGGGTHIYALIKDCGVEAPRLRKDGSPCTQGRKHENLWRSMRVLKDFSFKELALTASTNGVDVSEETAKDFIKDLRVAGYVLALNNGNRHTGLSRYRLVKNTGPKPPVIRKINQVYDRNEKRIVWPIKEEFEC